MQNTSPFVHMFSQLLPESDKKKTESDAQVYNIAVIGKSGAGKSSFINYLLPDLETKAKTGVGRPQTARGDLGAFHRYDAVLNGANVSVYDSWGLEANKYDVWMDDLSKEMDQRTISSTPNKWFHSVFHCISAAGNRVEDVDDKILSLFQEKKTPITVVLTHADKSSIKADNELSTEIKKKHPNVNVVSVCSVAEETRSGRSDPFGRDDVVKQCFYDFLESIAERVPDRCEHIMKERICEWRNYAENQRDNEIGVLEFFRSNKAYVLKSIENEANCCAKNIVKLGNVELVSALKMYSKGFDVFASGIHPDIQGARSKSDDFFGDWSEEFFTNALKVVFTGVISVPAAIYLVLGGEESSSKQDITDYINKAALELDNILFGHVGTIRRQLNTMKSGYRNNGQGPNL
jgi:GTP-binding protein EngB required for normal cell division